MLCVLNYGFSMKRKMKWNTFQDLSLTVKRVHYHASKMKFEFSLYISIAQLNLHTCFVAHSIRLLWNEFESRKNTAGYHVHVRMRRKGVNDIQMIHPKINAFTIFMIC